MKRFLVFFNLALGFASCMDGSSSADNSPVDSESPKEMLRIVERRDTIVSVDTATGSELIQVVVSYDTIVEIVQ